MDESDRKRKASLERSIITTDLPIDIDTNKYELVNSIDSNYKYKYKCNKLSNE